MEKDKLINIIREFGIIGAGGAGFPTNVKVNAKVDTVIINGAECEPLLYKDKEIMRLFPEEMVSGLKIVMEITGAPTGIIALKSKNKEAIPKLKDICKKYKGIKVEIIDDVYPSGDEVVLVYEVTKRIVPPGGIPLNVGCVVSNSETFLNIHYAVNSGHPVTEKYLTITGEVKHPVTIKVPVGTAIKDILPFAGGVTVKKPAFIDGGPMMGKVLFDENSAVTKTSAGYIVLSADHPLIIRKTLPSESTQRIGKSSCDQCSYCTEFCPRYLLGHDVRPHMVMRSLGLTGKQFKAVSNWSLLCVECKLCTLFSCPELLYPGESCGISKRELAKEGIRYVIPKDKVLKAHPMREYRKLPTKRLLERLTLSKYDKPAHFEKIDFKPKEITIMLNQHIGVPCSVLVKLGETVKCGQIIGRTPEGKMGASVHASIDGKVSEISSAYIKIKKS
ncbi:SLBB domain-containing protein [Candidatus Dependentiae bacterium]|nr:SLBB domain-containing protein [Candidatus Dependentiae bacterium]